MSDWEDTECLLCKASAKRYGFMDARGWKYDECSGGCPPYALKGKAHEHIRLFINDQQKRKIIVDFVKDEIARGRCKTAFFEITSAHLRKLGLLHDK